ncbi:MAG: chromate transporter, partial [Pseudomonadota bacterium]
MFAVFSGIGLLSFGGPAAQIALMHRKLVEEAGWLSERAYANALGFCMLLPGPEAMQLATYCGWKLRGVPGGLVAGLLFVIPGATAIFALAGLYAVFGNITLMSQLFLGIKSAVLVVVLEALLRLSRRALTDRSGWIIAVAAFAAIFFLSLPFPLI